MARKRTPTKGKAGNPPTCPQSDQDVLKNESERSEESEFKTTSRSGKDATIVQGGFRFLPVSPLLKFTLCVSAITVATCYAVYPELIHSTGRSQYTPLSLRRIIDSDDPPGSGDVLGSDAIRADITQNSGAHPSSHISKNTQVTEMVSPHTDHPVVVGDVSSKRSDPGLSVGPPSAVSIATATGDNTGQELPRVSLTKDGHETRRTSRHILQQMDENTTDNKVKEMSGVKASDGSQVPSSVTPNERTEPSDVQSSLENQSQEDVGAGGREDHVQPEVTRHKGTLLRSKPIVLTAEKSEIHLDPNHMPNIDKGHEQLSQQFAVGTESESHPSLSNTKPNENVRKRKTSDRTSEPRFEADRPATETYKATYQRSFTPAKQFVAGRRLAPVELLHQRPNNSSVKVYLFDDFLSEQECEGLIRAHDSHVDAYNTKPPIICFDSIRTLRKHIKDAGKKTRVTSKTFTPGTKCVDSSFSLQLQTWLNSNWSYSTAFYPGESKFSLALSERIQRTMGLRPENGGKFQITSYPQGKAYKTHTDCLLGSSEKRDRVVSVLMYLSDVDDGGETKFPELGIWVKPKKGRAIVWNNMSPSGVCEPHSKHAASLVRQGKKYILIRWYYYKSFPGLSHRPPPPQLPPRADDQAMVSCDNYDNGSCRWYDEWTFEHLVDYQKNKANLT